MLRCPDCASTEVTTEYPEAFERNPDYLENEDAVSRSPASCLVCEWVGERESLQDNGGWE